MTELAVFLPGLYGGGAERTMLNVADGFGQQGMAVDLVVGVPDGPLQSQIPSSVRYVPLDAPRTLMVLPGLVRYLRTTRPQAMLTALNRANLAALWARRLAQLGGRNSHNVQTRVVISERNTLSAEAGHGAALADRLYPMLSRRFYPWADGIVAVSQSVAEDLSRVTGIESDRITTVYNPVVTPLLQKKVAEPIKESALATWFEPDQPPVLLGVGRLSEQKDFGTLIQAFARATAGGSERLLILGEGEKRAELERLVESLGIEARVMLPGWVENPVAYMRRSRLFVLCSRWEGLPGVLIEALFAGVPIIATDAPGGSREVLAQGKYGALVPVGDVDRLAEAIAVELRKPRSSPPPESWQPYVLDDVLAQYRDILGPFQVASCTSSKKIAMKRGS